MLCLLVSHALSRSPSSALFSPVFGWEGSPTKIDEKGYPYSDLCTGGPSCVCKETVKDCRICVVWLPCGVHMLEIIGFSSFGCLVVLAALWCAYVGNHRVFRFLAALWCSYVGKPVFWPPVSSSYVGSCPSVLVSFARCEYVAKYRGFGPPNWCPFGRLQGGYHTPLRLVSLYFPCGFPVRLPLWFHSSDIPKVILNRNCESPATSSLAG